ncbi:MAG: YceI family protein [Solirubrobacterales bacterium]|nr:YceI family protein [Solirubrobacterales bacterium]
MIAAGTHALGPDDTALQVRTYREGRARRAGHDLLLDVTRWSATVTVAADGAPVAVALEADPRSLRVRAGTGGIRPLSEGDRAGIVANIADRVLGGEPIAFASGSVEPTGDGLAVRGDLTMAGATHPVTVRLHIDAGGSLAGTVAVTQSAWGIRPYSAMMGALRVRDEVDLIVAGRLPTG